MCTRSGWWIAALIGWSIPALTATAQADKPKRATEAAAKEGEDEGEPAVMPISVSLVAGYGHTFNAHHHLNPLGVAFGMRGGYSLASFYLGMRFMFFLGDSEETSIPTGVDDMGMPTFERIEVSANSMTLGLEGGYEVPLFGGALEVRPELGLGLVVGAAETMSAGAPETTPTDDESSEDLYIAPGFALHANLSKRVFAGIDTQFPIIFDSETEVALTVLGLAGMRF